MSPNEDVRPSADLGAAPAAPLAPDDAARLTEFARACKAAARIVVMYPDGHAAIKGALGRIVQVTSPPKQIGPMRVTVMPDTLMLDDRAPAKIDPALAELSELLHSHLIGEMTIQPGGGADAWRAFLLILARTPESVRAEGGITRVLATTISRHVAVREIDYADVLRERDAGESAAWDTVIENCLQGAADQLDDETVRHLLAIVKDPERLSALMSAIEGRAAQETDPRLKTTAMMRLLRNIVAAVSKTDPERMEPTLHALAAAIGQLSPDMVAGLLNQPAASADDENPRLMRAVVSRMTDGTIADFVARGVINDASTDRLAEAFQSLVTHADQRPRLLALARDKVAASPLGSTDGFDTAWNQVAEKMLTSYSDKPFVSEEYARELSGARTRALEVEQVNDDPPDRISGWLSTVATTALRALDLTLLLDLLRLEQDDTRWGELMTPLISLLDDLLLVGDFDAALQLINVLVKEGAGEGTKDRRQHAVTAIDTLVAGSMLRHLAAHFTAIDDAQFERVKTMCVSLGEVLVRPLAEALTTEERPRARERLTAILLAYGAVGRRTVERLKNSPNAAVRRTAIRLMRQFVGSDALPDLTELMNDNAPQVQREAVLAILTIGTNAAYQILGQALTTGTAQSREALLSTLSTSRDERAGPLWGYILHNIDHRGPLQPVYVRAIESLGTLRAPEGVGPLKDALYRGEWYAPGRTKMLRSAAAASLARIATPEAVAVLEEAAAAGPWNVRAVARDHLATVRTRPQPRPRS
ncbi:MAG TPA: HEAT repeat domain-containing protein [Vicinamibacterales bacterium]|nr:HEAT repeat domain-containing protein [Vicinamibacterales bacterium]